MMMGEDWPAAQRAGLARKRRARMAAGAARLKVLAAMLAACAALAALAVAARGQDTSHARIRACPPSDWCVYNRDDRGWRYSPLAQIDRGNVSRLRPVWTHQPGRVEHGIQSTPLVMDGALYYSTSYSRVHKLNGATGERIWHYYPELNQLVVRRQTHSPYSRGLAVGDGRVYMGTLDGRLIALTDATGEVAWDTTLIDSAKETVGFTGGGAYVDGMLIIGQQAGEWPIRGRVFGVEAATGKLKWTFYTVAGPEDPEAMATWGGDSWKYGGGGGWQPGGYDPEHGWVLWGTGNPNPLYDWGGEDWQSSGARPGRNLYTTSVVALDVRSGKLKWYHQEIPHDPYDFDSATGEFVFVERDGKRLVSHPSKSGFYYVYERDTGKLVNVFQGVNSVNFVERIDPKTGRLIGQWFPKEGVEEYLCPATAGGYSWNPGAYSPQTGLHYRVAQEWCIYVTVFRAEPITEPSAALVIGAKFRGARPPEPGNPRQEGTDRQHGRLDARDPVTGKIAWSRRYEVVPHSALLATAGGLLFNGTAMGWVEALDAATGDPLWRFNSGSPHTGGIVSYSVAGKQYIAVASGRGSLVMNAYDEIWPETFGKAGFEHSAVLMAFALPDY
jgi:PQQ-dependent dehydrogenase (methanol/ethanol family)